MKGGQKKKAETSKKWLTRQIFLVVTSAPPQVFEQEKCYNKTSASLHISRAELASQQNYQHDKWS
jgi:hypothetical protein